MDHDVVSSGVSAKINLDPNVETHKYALQLNFNGSEGLDFSPLGKVTTVEVQSNWPDPSFDGAFLPDSRQISDSGFTASWKVLHLNRSIPQQFIGKQRNMDEADFGVKLMLPVDQYQKSTRAVKYAILLISLTFLVFFFSQIKKQLRVHPIQYLMIGLAICLFFVLLVAISEHWNFDGAYLLGAIAMIGVITGYSHLSFRNTMLTRVLLVTLSTIYTFIYVIIQLQDHALLLGSIGLFIILAVVMFMSRNVDWYNVGRKE
jgi:inner membrane protein